MLAHSIDVLTLSVQPAEASGSLQNIFKAQTNVTTVCVQPYVVNPSTRLSASTYLPGGRTHRRVAPSWQRPATSWEMTLQHRWHSSRGRKGVARIISAKGQTWKWLCALLLMLGSLSLSLSLLRLKWTHNAVCLLADRFQMLMAGSWCEGLGGWGGYSLLLGGKSSETNLEHRGRNSALSWKSANSHKVWGTCTGWLQTSTEKILKWFSSLFLEDRNASFCTRSKHAHRSGKKRLGIPGRPHCQTHYQCKGAPWNDHVHLPKQPSHAQLPEMLSFSQGSPQPPGSQPPHPTIHPTLFAL